MRASFVGRVFAAAVLGIAVGAAAVAQTAAPAQGAPERREFTLFFDFASAQPSPLAKQIIEHAARAAKERQADGSFSHVKVIGYADTAGSAAASQHISERRAEVVRDELVRLGLDAQAINVEGRGKKELAVRTEDRIREPRNRRTRVVIYGPGE
jgi:outer membrane protein OmpA-like peptidoglycan-associated protein